MNRNEKLANAETNTNQFLYLRLDTNLASSKGHRCKKTNVRKKDFND